LFPRYEDVGRSWDRDMARQGERKITQRHPDRVGVDAGAQRRMARGGTPSVMMKSVRNGLIAKELRRGRCAGVSVRI
jgi:hypothetical protein